MGSASAASVVFVKTSYQTANTSLNQMAPSKVSIPERSFRVLAGPGNTISSFRPAGMTE
jgi:hypothetical protein